MNDTKKETAAVDAPKQARGFRVQTGLRAAGEKQQYLVVKMQDILITG